MDKIKITIGLTEIITIYGKERVKVRARIDTGAMTSSMDLNLAKKLNLGPVIKSRHIRSANGSGLRPVIEAVIMLAGKKIKTEFNLTSRDHMRYPILIGQKALKKYFLIDPDKE